MIIKTILNDDNSTSKVVNFQYVLSFDVLRDIFTIFIYVWAFIVTLKIFGVLPLSWFTILLFPIVKSVLILVIAFIFEIMAGMFLPKFFGGKDET